MQGQTTEKVGCTSATIGKVRLELCSWLMTIVGYNYSALFFVGISANSELEQPVVLHHPVIVP